MAKVELVIPVKVGEENRIFGSITAQQVVDGLAANGITVDRRKVEITDEIKIVGVYSATVKIHADVVAEVKLRVEPETADA